MSRSNTVFDLDWYDQVHAKKMKELYPKVSSVHVILRRVLGKKEVREYDLAPEEVVHLSINFLNPKICGVSQSTVQRIKKCFSL